MPKWLGAKANLHGIRSQGLIRHDGLLVLEFVARPVVARSEVMEMTRQAIIAELRKAIREEKVNVEFRDGKVVEGAILFNESKGCGKVINIDKEISVDFRLDQIAAIRI